MWHTIWVTAWIWNSVMIFMLVAGITVCRSVSQRCSSGNFSRKHIPPSEDSTYKYYLLLTTVLGCSTSSVSLPNWQSLGSRLTSFFKSPAKPSWSNKLGLGSDSPMQWCSRDHPIAAWTAHVPRPCPFTARFPKSSFSIIPRWSWNSDLWL